MGFIPVLLNIRKFRNLLVLGETFLKENKPDAVVVIDNPGFHWHLAKRAKAAGIPVYYFVPPQLWAWGGYRVKKMKASVDYVLTSLPFEQKWYADRGMPCHYIGHPYFDELAHQKLDPVFIGRQARQPGRVVAILPGSRDREVKRNLPLMLAAAERIHAKHPDTRFIVAAFKDAHADGAREQLVGSTLPVTVEVKKTPEILQSAHCCIAVSGSVSLEIMNALKPAVIVYRAGFFGVVVARKIMQVRFITLVNLLAGREIFPEFLCFRDPDEEIADRIDRWLSSDDERRATVEGLKALKTQVAQPGAADRAAEFVLSRVRGAIDASRRAA